jgi:hypothetical protein
MLPLVADILQSGLSGLHPPYPPASSMVAKTGRKAGRKTPKSESSLHLAYPFLCQARTRRSENAHIYSVHEKTTRSSQSASRGLMALQPGGSLSTLSDNVATFLLSLMRDVNPVSCRTFHRTLSGNVRWPTVTSILPTITPYPCGHCPMFNLRTIRTNARSRAPASGTERSLLRHQSCSDIVR